VAAFKKAAGYVLELSDIHLAELIGAGKFTEAQNHGQEIPE
jgi:hypothetical protein